jgi:twinkle protein
MKIVSATTKRTYNITINGQAKEERITCPECSDSRKNNPKEKCLSWNTNNNIGYCHHCETTFFQFKPYQSQKEYFVPEWKNITNLSDKAVKYFEGRMIKQEVLLQMKVYSDKIFMPQFNKDVPVICFPYFRDGKLVNIKYRGPKKTFKLVKNAELIFWNLDCIADSDEIIITEGEIDALCFLQTGYNAISVPNGANANMMEYLDSSVDLFKDKKIYLAIDNDMKGISLRDELIRRLGPENCLLINLKDAKDANEYLIKYGADFYTLINEAKAVPVKGVIKANDIYNDLLDYFNVGIQKGLELEFFEIDKYINWETGRLAVVTGIPSHGKSEFVDFIISRLNVLHGWKAGFFTPENYPLKFHYAKMFEKLAGKRFHKDWSSESLFNQVYDYINDNFFYILNEDNFTLDEIITNAKYLVRNLGIKILVIDPYNKIDHSIGNLSETQYISNFLDQMGNFARFYDCLVFLIAHPRKMENEGHKHKCPTLYDISGSAHFYNKCDYGFTIYRKRDEDTREFIHEVEVHWQKIKFRHLGETGTSTLKYNYNNGRFESGDKTVNDYDTSNWLEKKSNNKELLPINEVPF